MTGRVVAELGRAETPEETAQRKATSSRAYRSSQTARNLVAALLVTVAVVAVVILVAPRGEVPAQAPIDVNAVAQRLSEAEQRTVITPELPENWRVNQAGVDNEGLRVWSIVYVPYNATGFIRISQGFDADPAWTARELSGATADGQLTIDGVTWTRYAIDNPDASGNITGALEAQAGADTVLVYGTASAQNLERAAASVSDDIRTMNTESP